MSSSESLRSTIMARARSTPHQTVAESSELPRQSAYPTSLLSRAYIPPWALSPKAVTQLQRTIGNQEVCNVLAGATLRHQSQAQAPASGPVRFSGQVAHDPRDDEVQRLIVPNPIKVTQTIGSGRIQRSLLDQGSNTFADSVESTLAEAGQMEDNDLVETLFTLLYSTQMALGDSQRHGKKDLLALLTELQRLLEEWKYTTPNQQKLCEAIWKELYGDIKTKIEEVTQARVAEMPTGKRSGKDLAEAKEAVLQSLAMRILVANVATYQNTDKTGADNIPMERLKRHGKGARPVHSVVVHEKTYKKTTKTVEEDGVAACTQFAYAAAKILEGTEVRVDVVSGKGMAGGTGHTYVLVGREGDDVWDIKTWGDGCVIVDCWAGALEWESFEKNPQVIYEKNQWDGQYTINEHVSDSHRGYAASEGDDVKKAVVKERFRPQSKTETPTYMKKIRENQQMSREGRLEASANQAKDRAGKHNESEPKESEPKENTDTDLKTVSSWEEAENMKWLYGDVFMLDGKFYETKTVWPRTHAGGSSEEKPFKDWVREP